MIVRSSGLTPQSCATFATTFAGGGRLLSMTKVAFLARSAYGKSWNSGSRRASARAGPEPSAKKECSPSFSDRRQPAYWLARQAMTGLDERTTIAHGQRGVAADGPSRTSASPPMQISAMRRPAAMLPRCLLPASMSVSPSSPRVIPILSSAASAINPRNELRGPLIHTDRVRRLHDFLPLVQARTISRRWSAIALAAAAAEP